MPAIYRATRPPQHNTDLGFAFVPTWREPDDSYPSTANRRKPQDGCVFNKVSWILEGQDREGGFVIALRKLYKTVAFPDAAMVKVLNTARLAGESIRIPKQLIGLPDYGARTLMRDEETYELITATAVEQPEKRRFRTRQIIFNDIQKLSEAQGPRQLCRALRDAMCGLLNAFRMGYVHREITPDIIYIVKHPSAHTMGYMLSKDGKSVEGDARYFSGFLYDFTVCQKIDGTDDQYTGDTELFEHTVSTPTNLLSVKLKDRADIVHTPIYDLESFLWVLLSVATEIITDYVAGRRKVELDYPEIIDENAINEKEGSADGLLGKSPLSDELTIKSSTEAKQTVSNIEEPIQKDSAEATFGGIAINDLEVKVGEEAKAIGLEGRAPILNEPQLSGDADEAMDIDDDKANAEKKEVNGEDAKMDEDDEPPNLEEEEERKRKRNDEADSEKSKKAKGKHKATVETDDEATSSDNRALSDDEAPSDIDSDNFLDHVVSLKRFMSENVRPPEFKPPPGFVPPQKPQYVAFAEDKSSVSINLSLRPRSPSSFDKVTREYLLFELDKLLADSADLAPFRPLVNELRSLVEEYRARCVSLQTEFSKDEVEEAFARYLAAFEKHMPEQDNWLCLKWYEGSDMLLKFGKDGFLGAFASTTHTSSTQS